MKKILITIVLLCNFGICHQLQAQITSQLAIPLFESATGKLVRSGEVLYHGSTYYSDVSFLPLTNPGGYGHDDCFTWFTVYANGTAIYSQGGVLLKFTLPNSVDIGSKITIRFNGRGASGSADYKVGSRVVEWPVQPPWGGYIPVY